MVLSIQRPNSNYEYGGDRQNWLLNLLPESERQNILIHSDTVTLSAKTNLYQFDEPLERAYFPLQGIISLINVDRNGAISEVAAVSNEGLVGIAGLLGGNRPLNLTVAQTDCLAVSLPISILRREFARAGELQRILLLYTQALLIQISQNVFCSSQHTLEQRLARWLLFYSDRLHGKTLLLTQETLADLLGVRRSSLSTVAANLRQRKLIHYSRGKIKLLDSEALRQLACECDRQIYARSSRLLYP